MTSQDLDDREDMSWWRETLTRLHSFYIEPFIATTNPSILFPVTPAEKAETERILSDFRKLAPHVPNLRLEPVISQASRQIEINPLHVEPLVRRAGSLLDRALADHAAWYQLNLERFRVAMELLEFSLSDAIHRDEEANDYHRQKEYEATATRDAEQALESSAQAALTTLHTYLSDRRSKEAIEDRAKKAGGLTGNGLDPVQVQGKQGTWDTRTYAGVQGHAMHIGETLSSGLTTADLTDDREKTKAEAQQVHGAHAAAAAKAKGLTKKAAYATLDSDFSRRKSRLQRLLGRLKAHSFQQDGGALNFKERMEQVEHRYRADLDEALQLMSAARAGLQLVYGFDLEAMPPRDHSRLLDACVGWIRCAANVLERIALSDHAESVVVRTKVDPANDWVVTLQEDDFPDRAWIRLRGISAYLGEHVALLGGDKGASYTIEVAPPEVATFVRRPTENASIVRTPKSGIAQRAASYRLAPVGPRTWPAESGRSRVPAWHNVSPLGDWRFRFVGNDRPKMETVVEVEFLVAVHPIVKQ
jgi:hypothetical protein